MFIELLESRIAPAAIINLTNTLGGGLKIAGAAAGQNLDITVSPDPAGGVDVTALDGATFTLNGVAVAGTEVQVAKVFGNIVVNAGDSTAGNSITFSTAPGGEFGGSLTVNIAGPSGAGVSNDIFFDQAKSAGGLAVNAVTPADVHVHIEGAAPSVPVKVGGPVKLAFGTGNNSVEIDVPLIVDGSLSYLGGPTKAGASLTGSNTFHMPTSAGSLDIAGGLTFNSKFAPASFQIAGKNTGDALSNLLIGGNVSIQEQSMALPGQVDTMAGQFVLIGGSLSWTNTTGGFSLAGGTMNVQGKINFLGLSEVIAGFTLESGGVAAASLANLPGTFTLEVGTLYVGGSIGVSNQLEAFIAGGGHVGGKISVTNSQTVEINSDAIYNPFANPLRVGGSVSLSAPTNPTGPGSFDIGNIEVGGSLTVAGNPLIGGEVSLTNASIFGSASFKGLGNGATLSFVQDSGSGLTQMLIAGNLAVSLAGSGNTFSVTDGNTNPALFVLGTTAIKAPLAGSDTLPAEPSPFFAFTPKVTM